MKLRLFKCTELMSFVITLSFAYLESGVNYFRSEALSIQIRYDYALSSMLRSTSESVLSFHHEVTYAINTALLFLSLTTPKLFLF